MKHQKSPHLTQAHALWKQFLHPGDCVIDATCGNGHDTLFLAQLLLPHPNSFLAAIDIQQQAIENTAHLLKKSLENQLRHQFLLERRCHTTLTSLPLPQKPRLIVYNLGYLPGGNKSITTTTEHTLYSLSSSLSLLSETGALSITCYPGHPEGAREEAAIMHWARQLASTEWRCSLYQIINRPSSPSLLWLTRPSHKKYHRQPEDPALEPNP